MPRACSAEGARRTSSSPSTSTEILGWYRGFADVAGRGAGRRRSTRSRAKDWTLNISRYVAAADRQHDIPPLPEAVAAFKDALATLPRGRGATCAQVMAEGGWLR